MLAENGREVLKWAYENGRLDLIILDPDLPDAEEIHVLERLQDRIPSLPVIMHTYQSEFGAVLAHPMHVVLIEKGARSVERLKKEILEILTGPKPRGKQAASNGKHDVKVV